MNNSITFQGRHVLSKSGTAEKLPYLNVVRRRRTSFRNVVCRDRTS